MLFPGFLLPRLARLGIWGVVLNAGLFSLYYVWAPGQILTRLLFLTPLIYAVWRTRESENWNLVSMLWQHSRGARRADTGVAELQLIGFTWREAWPW